MNLFNKIKKLFTKKSDIIIEDILDGDFIDFVNISAVSFLHESVVQSIYQDIIVLIINNNLVADPSKILAFFKRNYNFTNNEFFVLAFKMGVIVKMYVDNPVLMLESVTLRSAVCPAPGLLPTSIKSPIFSVAELIRFITPS